MNKFNIDKIPNIRDDFRGLADKVFSKDTSTNILTDKSLMDIFAIGSFIKFSMLNVHKQRPI